MTRLGDVVKIAPSTASLTGEQHWLLNLDMVEQQTGRIIEYHYVDTEELDGSIVQFGADAVLYSKLRPNLNKVVLPEMAGFATSEMLPLVPDTSVLSRSYLAYFLRSEPFVTWAVSKTAGAKMPRLGSKELLGKEIPIPSLAEQSNIAAQFEKVDSLISLRKQQIAKLDELVKARFVEMFGDPIKNRSKKKLSEIGRIFTGNTPSMKEPAYYDGEDIPFIKPGDLKEIGVTNIEGIQSYISEKARPVARIIPSYSVLVTCIGTIGKIGITTEESACNQQINFIVPNKNTNSVYLAYCLTFFKEILLNMANAPVVPIINKTQFSELEIPVFSFEQQNQFAAFVAQTDQQKSTIQHSLAQLELLKKALMQKYFG